MRVRGEGEGRDRVVAIPVTSRPARAAGQEADCMSEGEVNLAVWISRRTWVRVRVRARVRARARARVWVRARARARARTRVRVGVRVTRVRVRAG